MNKSIKRHTRRKVLGHMLAPVLVATLGLVSIPAFSADSWPTRPIELIVPFGPGGTTDLLARLVADGISTELGQSVIVQNKPGAGANIGAPERLATHLKAEQARYGELLKDIKDTAK